MSKPFDPYLTGGVTRNPYHPKGKQVFALNFDDLAFKVDGVVVPTELVQGAFPHVQCVIVFVLDEDGLVRLNEHSVPLTESVKGKVEIIGTPLTCGCSMHRFQVSRWWSVKLTDG